MRHTWIKTISKSTSECTRCGLRRQTGVKRPDGTVGSFYIKGLDSYYVAPECKE